MTGIRSLCTAVLILQGGQSYATGVDTITGDWRTVRHGAEIRIEDCGDGTPCGFLVAVAEDIRGEATHDERNHDRALRDRPLRDLPILWGYRAKGSGWTSGRLYNPETGQTFRSSLEAVSPDELRVRGCLGPFCREQTWTRILEHAGDEREVVRHD